MNSTGTLVSMNCQLDFGDRFAAPCAANGIIYIASRGGRPHSPAVPDASEIFLYVPGE
jgi:hypothetical protein